MEKAIGTRSFWLRASFLYAIINLSFSQIAFNNIHSNLDQFPRDLLFYLWVLLWFQLLPWLLLMLLDVFVEKVTHQGKWWIVWRSLLCLLLALSLIRQFQTLYYLQFTQILFLTLPVIYAIPPIVVFWVSYRWPKIVHTYISHFGVVSLILTIVFVQNGRPISYQSSAAKNSGPSHTPVFMIVFDEFSYSLLQTDGRIDRASFPNFAMLADGGLWFTNVTTNHWMTEKAVPALLTGNVYANENTPSLFERLPAGYRVRLVETEMTVENWLRERKATKDIESIRGKGYFLSHSPVYTEKYVVDLAYRPFFSGRIQSQGIGARVMANPSAAMVNTRAYHLTLFDEMASFFQTIDAKTAPSQFSLWHASVPHTPFIFDANGGFHADSFTFFPLEKRLRSQAYNSVMNNYRTQARFADTILGQVIKRLKQEHLYDSALVIVVADHGLRVWGDLYSHVDMTARVPLLLHGAGIQPGVCDFDVQLVDLVPTLLDLLKAPYQPSQFDGVSAFSTSRPQRQKVLHIYPQDFAYDPKANTWQPVQSGEEKKGVASVSSALLTAALSQKREFSAIQVQDDLFAAHDHNEDFLEIYLDRHFPETISDDDLNALRIQAKNSEALPKTPGNNFRKGIYYFFVALAETERISQGHHEDPARVQADWEKTLELFRNVGDLQPWMAEEIEKLLKEADRDGDHKLSEQELSSIITTHLS